MANKIYSFPKEIFEHYHNKIKEWVRAVLPAGFYTGSFSDVGSNAYFWTITESGSNAYYRRFDTGATMHQYTNSKDYGFSVRLVKDVT